MYVDYTDLNKHCPKDPFGLPRIDEVIDSTAGCELLSFLDCYSGYHQIALNKDDQIKTSFIMTFGAYCYTTMSFGLKNVRATYQCAIQNYLQNEIKDDLVEAYVDDVVVKTKEAIPWSTISSLFSRPLTSTNGSLILISVSSESRLAYCWVTSSVTTSYAPIQLRSRLFWIYSPRKTSRISRSSLDVWLPSAASSRDSTRRAYLSSNCLRHQ
jgi:hypothetical protein